VLFRSVVVVLLEAVNHAVDEKTFQFFL